MLTLLLVTTAAAVWLWQDGMAARECAREWARKACHRAGTQLLDDTVQLQHIGLRRLSGPRVRLERYYAFEHTDDGLRRRSGGVRVVGRHAQMIDLERADHREHMPPSAPQDPEG